MSTTPVSTPSAGLSLVHLNRNAVEATVDGQPVLASVQGGGAPMPNSSEKGGKGKDAPARRQSRLEKLFSRSHVVERYMDGFSEAPYACHLCGRVATPEDSEEVRGQRRSTLMAEEPIFLRAPHPDETKFDRTVNGSAIALTAGPIGPIGPDGGLLPDAPTTTKDGKPLTGVPVVDNVHPFVVCQCCFGGGMEVLPLRWEARFSNWASLQSKVEGIDFDEEAATVKAAGPRLVPLREVLAVTISIEEGREYVARKEKEASRTAGLARLAGGLTLSGLSLSKRERQAGKALVAATVKAVERERASEQVSGTGPKVGSRTARLFGGLFGGKGSEKESEPTEATPAADGETTRVVLAADQPAAPAPPPALASLADRLAVARLNRIAQIAIRVEKATELGGTHAITASLLREKGPVVCGQVEPQADGTSRIRRIGGSEDVEVSYLRSSACTDLRTGTPSEVAAGVFDAQYPSLAAAPVDGPDNSENAPEPELAGATSAS